jgi:hypothetical protein
MLTGLLITIAVAILLIEAIGVEILQGHIPFPVFPID